MLIKTKINNDQKYVKISEPSLDEFLSSGKPSVTNYYKTKEKYLPGYDLLKCMSLFWTPTAP